MSKPSAQQEAKMEPSIPTPRHPVRETRAAAKRREASEAKERELAKQTTAVPAGPADVPNTVDDENREQLHTMLLARQCHSGSPVRHKS